MTVLLDANRFCVLAVALDLHRRRELLGPQRLARRPRITFRHSRTYIRQAHSGSGDLVSRSAGKCAQAVRAGDKRTPPLAEGFTCLAHPTHVPDMTVQLLGGLLDGVPRIPQRLAGALQVFRIRLFHEIDHLVEVVVLEVRPALHGRTQRRRIDSRLQQPTEEPE
ncbi:hypothetical protein [Streptomyces sp. enrichment culture]|uniref:hypothetical protein n=1 Tax=Streptomyces sp. enrichment culture TaxID=1795815 RepID=UPI003F56EB9C